MIYVILAASVVMVASRGKMTKIARHKHYFSLVFAMYTERKGRVAGEHFTTRAAESCQVYIMRNEVNYI